MDIFSLSLSLSFPLFVCVSVFSLTLHLSLLHTFKLSAKNGRGIQHFIFLHQNLTLPVFMLTVLVIGYYLLTYEYMYIDWYFKVIKLQLRSLSRTELFFSAPAPSYCHFQVHTVRKPWLFETHFWLNLSAFL